MFGGAAIEESVPAMGGKRMAITPRKMSLEHMAGVGAVVELGENE